MALRCVSESRRSSATNTPNTSARSTSWRATITSLRVKVVTGKIKATNGTPQTEYRHTWQSVTKRQSIHAPISCKIQKDLCQPLQKLTQTSVIGHCPGK